VQRSSVRRVVAAIVLFYALSDGANACLHAELAGARGRMLPWVFYFDIVACAAGVTAAVGLKWRRTWALQSYGAWAALAALDSVLTLAQFAAGMVSFHRSLTRLRGAPDDPFTHAPVIMATVAAQVLGTLALLGALWLGYRYLTEPGPAKAGDPGD
jgi:hypothetical protein